MFRQPLHDSIVALNRFREVPAAREWAGETLPEALRVLLIQENIAFASEAVCRNAILGAVSFCVYAATERTFLPLAKLIPILLNGTAAYYHAKHTVAAGGDHAATFRQILRTAVFEILPPVVSAMSSVLEPIPAADMSTAFIGVSFAQAAADDFDCIAQLQPTHRISMSAWTGYATADALTSSSCAILCATRTPGLSLIEELPGVMQTLAEAQDILSQFVDALACMPDEVVKRDSAAPEALNRVIAAITTLHKDAAVIQRSRPHRVLLAIAASALVSSSLQRRLWAIDELSAFARALEHAADQRQVAASQDHSAERGSVAPLSVWAARASTSAAAEIRMNEVDGRVEHPSPRMLAAWLESPRINFLASVLLGTSTHEEVMRRSGELLGLLVRCGFVREDHVERLWQGTIAAHSAALDAHRDLLATLATHARHFAPQLGVALLRMIGATANDSGGRYYNDAVLAAARIASIPAVANESAVAIPVALHSDPAPIPVVVPVASQVTAHTDTVSIALTALLFQLLSHPAAPPLPMARSRHGKLSSVAGESSASQQGIDMKEDTHIGDVGRNDDANDSSIVGSNSDRRDEICHYCAEDIARDLSHIDSDMNGCGAGTKMASALSQQTYDGCERARRCRCHDNTMHGDPAVVGNACVEALAIKSALRSFSANGDARSGIRAAEDCDAVQSATQTALVVISDAFRSCLQTLCEPQLVAYYFVECVQRLREITASRCDSAAHLASDEQPLFSKLVTEDRSIPAGIKLDGTLGNSACDSVPRILLLIKLLIGQVHSNAWSVVCSMNHTVGDTGLRTESPVPESAPHFDAIATGMTPDLGGIATPVGRQHRQTVVDYISFVQTGSPRESDAVASMLLALQHSTGFLSTIFTETLSYAGQTHAQNLQVTALGARLSFLYLLLRHTPGIRLCAEDVFDLWAAVNQWPRAVSPCSVSALASVHGFREVYWRWLFLVCGGNKLTTQTQPITTSASYSPMGATNSMPPLESTAIPYGSVSYAQSYGPWGPQPATISVQEPTALDGGAAESDNILFPTRASFTSASTGTLDWYTPDVPLGQQRHSDFVATSTAKQEGVTSWADHTEGLHGCQPHGAAILSVADQALAWSCFFGEAPPLNTSAPAYSVIEPSAVRAPSPSNLRCWIAKRPLPRVRLNDSLQNGIDAMYHPQHRDVHTGDVDKNEAMHDSATHEELAAQPEALEPMPVFIRPSSMVPLLGQSAFVCAQLLWLRHVARPEASANNPDSSCNASPGIVVGSSMIELDRVDTAASDFELQGRKSFELGAAPCYPRNHVIPLFVASPAAPSTLGEETASSAIRDQLPDLFWQLALYGSSRVADEAARIVLDYHVCERRRAAATAARMWQASGASTSPPKLVPISHHTLVCRIVAEVERQLHASHAPAAPSWIIAVKELNASPPTSLIAGRCLSMLKEYCANLVVGYAEDVARAVRCIADHGSESPRMLESIQQKRDIIMTKFIPASMRPHRTRFSAVAVAAGVVRSTPTMIPAVAPGSPNALAVDEASKKSGVFVEGASASTNSTSQLISPRGTQYFTVPYEDTSAASRLIAVLVDGGITLPRFALRFQSAPQRSNATGRDNSNYAVADALTLTQFATASAHHLLTSALTLSEGQYELLFAVMGSPLCEDIGFVQESLRHLTWQLLMELPTSPALEHALVQPASVDWGRLLSPSSSSVALPSWIGVQRADTTSHNVDNIARIPFLPPMDNEVPLVSSREGCEAWKALYCLQAVASRLVEPHATSLSETGSPQSRTSSETSIEGVVDNLPTPSQSTMSSIADATLTTLPRSSNISSAEVPEMWRSAFIGAGGLRVVLQQLLSDTIGNGLRTTTLTARHVAHRLRRPGRTAASPASSQLALEIASVCLNVLNSCPAETWFTDLEPTSTSSEVSADCAAGISRIVRRLLCCMCIADDAAKSQSSSDKNAAVRSDARNSQTSNLGNVGASSASPVSRRTVGPPPSPQEKAAGVATPTDSCNEFGISALQLLRKLLDTSVLCSSPSLAPASTDSRSYHLSVAAFSVALCDADALDNIARILLGDASELADALVQNIIEPVLLQDSMWPACDSGASRCVLMKAVTSRIVTILQFVPPTHSSSHAIWRLLKSLATANSAHGLTTTSWLSVLCETITRWWWLQISSDGSALPDDEDRESGNGEPKVEIPPSALSSGATPTCMSDSALNLLYVECAAHRRTPNINYHCSCYARHVPRADGLEQRGCTWLPTAPKPFLAASLRCIEALVAESSSTVDTDITVRIPRLVAVMLGFQHDSLSKLNPRCYVCNATDTQLPGTVAVDYVTTPALFCGCWHGAHLVAAHAPALDILVNVSTVLGLFGLPASVPPYDQIGLSKTSEVGGAVLPVSVLAHLCRHSADRGAAFALLRALLIHADERPDRHCTFDAIMTAVAHAALGARRSNAAICVGVSNVDDFDAPLGDPIIDPSEWHFAAGNETAGGDDENNKSHFVGLVNAGQTCYINALVQQLYMTPAMRRTILRANVALDVIATAAESSSGGIYELSPNALGDKIQASATPAITSTTALSTIGGARLLCELQRTFLWLRGGNIKAYDPRRLVDQCTSLNLPNPVYQQNDASEFCDKLMAVIESQLTGSAEASALRQIFGGATCQMKQWRCCGAIATTRAQPFVFLSLGIRDKASINDALADHFRPQEMTGDNAVWCDACGKKSPMRLQEAIASLPGLLLLHLNRFEVDFNNNNRVMKLNNRVAFPRRLSMREYTIPPVDGGPDDEDRDVDDAYELAGVVVHSGTAQSGHYYSFIRDRGEGERPLHTSASFVSATETSNLWYRFDDNSVTPFSMAALADEAFGGIQKVFMRRKVHPYDEYEVEKPIERSALLLFYDRVSLPRSRQHRCNKRVHLSPELSVMPSDARMPVSELLHCVDTSAKPLSPLNSSRAVLVSEIDALGKANARAAQHSFAVDRNLRVFIAGVAADFVADIIKESFHLPATTTHAWLRDVLPWPLAHVSGADSADIAMGLTVAMAQQQRDGDGGRALPPAFVHRELISCMRKIGENEITASGSQGQDSSRGADNLLVISPAAAVRRRPRLLITILARVLLHVIVHLRDQGPECADVARALIALTVAHPPSARWFLWQVSGRLPIAIAINNAGPAAVAAAVIRNSDVDVPTSKPALPLPSDVSVVDSQSSLTMATVTAGVTIPSLQRISETSSGSAPLRSAIALQNAVSNSWLARCLLYCSNGASRTLFAFVLRSAIETATAHDASGGDDLVVPTSHASVIQHTVCHGQLSGGITLHRPIDSDLIRWKAADAARMAEALVHRTVYEPAATQYRLSRDALADGPEVAETKAMDDVAKAEDRFDSALGAIQATRPHEAELLATHYAFVRATSNGARILPAGLPRPPASHLCDHVEDAQVARAGDALLTARSQLDVATKNANVARARVAELKEVSDRAYALLLAARSTTTSAVNAARCTPGPSSELADVLATLAEMLNSPTFPAERCAERYWTTWGDLLHIVRTVASHIRVVSVDDLPGSSWADTSSLDLERVNSFGAGPLCAAIGVPLALARLLTRGIDNDMLAETQLRSPRWVDVVQALVVCVSSPQLAIHALGSLAEITAPAVFDRLLSIRNGAPRWQFNYTAFGGSGPYIGEASAIASSYVIALLAQQRRDLIMGVAIAFAVPISTVGDDGGSVVRSLVRIVVVHTRELNAIGAAACVPRAASSAGSAVHIIVPNAAVASVVEQIAVLRDMPLLRTDNVPLAAIVSHSIVSWLPMACVRTGILLGGYSAVLVNVIARAPASLRAALVRVSLLGASFAELVRVAVPVTDQSRQLNESVAAEPELKLCVLGPLNTDTKRRLWGPHLREISAGGLLAPFGNVLESPVTGAAASQHTSVLTSGKFDILHPVITSVRTILLLALVGRDGAIFSNNSSTVDDPAGTWPEALLVLQLLGDVWFDAICFMSTARSQMRSRIPPAWLNSVASAEEALCRRIQLPRRLPAWAMDDYLVDHHIEAGALLWFALRARAAVLRDIEAVAFAGTLSQHFAHGASTPATWRTSGTVRPHQGASTFLNLVDGPASTVMRLPLPAPLLASSSNVAATAVNAIVFQVSGCGYACANGLYTDSGDVLGGGRVFERRVGSLSFALIRCQMHAGGYQWFLCVSGDRNAGLAGYPTSAFVSRSIGAAAAHDHDLYFHNAVNAMSPVGGPEAWSVAAIAVPRCHCFSWSNARLILSPAPLPCPTVVQVGGPTHAAAFFPTYGATRAASDASAGRPYMENPTNAIPPPSLTGPSRSGLSHTAASHINVGDNTDAGSPVVSRESVGLPQQLAASSQLRHSDSIEEIPAGADSAKTFFHDTAAVEAVNHSREEPATSDDASNARIHAATPLSTSSVATSVEEKRNGTQVHCDNAGVPLEDQASAAMNGNTLEEGVARFYGTSPPQTPPRVTTSSSANSSGRNARYSRDDASDAATHEESDEDSRDDDITECHLDVPTQSATALDLSDEDQRIAQVIEVTSTTVDEARAALASRMWVVNDAILELLKVTK